MSDIACQAGVVLIARHFVGEWQHIVETVDIHLQKSGADWSSLDSVDKRHDPLQCSLPFPSMELIRCLGTKNHPKYHLKTEYIQLRYKNISCFRHKLI